MKPVKFPQMNMMFTSSDKKDKTECPAWVGKDADGKDCVVTYWEIDPDELHKLILSGSVGVYITTPGFTAPIIGAQTHSPFDKQEETPPPKQPGRIISLN